MSRIVGSGWALWFYAYKALLPLKLSAIYPLWKIDTSSWLSYLPVVVLTACCVTFGCIGECGTFGRYSICVIWASLMLSLSLRHVEQNACLRKSRSALERCDRKEFDARSAHVNLGNAFLQVGKIQDAVVEYEAALKIEPFLPEPHNNIGTILIRSGQ